MNKTRLLPMMTLCGLFHIYPPEVKDEFLTMDVLRKKILLQMEEKSFMLS